MTQLNITLVTTGNPVVVVPIPPALQNLDSNNSSGAGQVGQQTGFSAVDALIRSIFKAGVFYVPSTQTWYSAFVIQSITYQ